MKIQRKNLPGSIVELTIEESKDKVAKYRKDAIEHLKKNANIKGFRKWGNIPEEVIIKQYGEDHILELTVNNALDSVYQEALKKEKLLPVSQAQIDEIISQDPLIIRLHVEVFPEITIDAKYKKIKIKSPKVKVEKDEVEKTLEEIQKRFTKFEETQDKKYEIQSWDRVTIDTQWFDAKWTALAQTDMKDYPLIIGTNVLVPGFEDGLIWKKSGEEVDLKITFPKDYHSTEFAGKKTVFKVHIKKIEQAVKPEFTPEFIKDIRGKELDIEGFKKLIHEEILETKQANQRLDNENKLIDELEKVTKVELWESMLANQIKNVFEEIKQNLQEQNGVKMNDYLASLNLSEDQYKEENVKPIARRRLFGELVLHKLLEMEKTQASDAEVVEESKTILSRFENPDVVKRLEELYKPGERYFEELKQRIKYKKLIDSFFE